MISVEDIINRKVFVEPIDEAYARKVKENFDKIAKPLDSLGEFEKLLSRVGGIQRSEIPMLSKSRILVMCADNGIVEEGISQSSQDITRICAENIALYKSSVGIMAQREDIDVLCTDVGINCDKELPKVLSKKIRNGSRNFLNEPAMTTEETLKAMSIGFELVKKSVSEGYNIIGLGEMGIGNTTTSSAVAAALLKETAADMTGRGAGLKDDKLLHKREVVAFGVEKYNLYEANPLTVLSCVGGYDIASLAGACIGGLYYHVPVVLDGFISMVAALTAVRLVPEVLEVLIPSHISREPAVKRISKELNLNPVINADMALGEGTGAVLMMSLLKTINEVYLNSCSFEAAGIEQYERYKG